MPGCYGTYIARCLYSYTDLRQEEYTPFMFDSSGSSHIHRLNQEAQQKINHGHPGQLLINSTDQIITVLTDEDHFLDYYDNQFHKQENRHIINYIKNHFTIDEITLKLKNHWSHAQAFDESVPVWMLREWCSFWIQDCLNNSYSIKPYQDISISTQDIFLNFIDTFRQLCWALNLSINIEPDLILADNKFFYDVQHYHNIQLTCWEWVDCCLTNTQSLLNPCKTIFDEAYVQHLFRQRGYEIQCNELDAFPTTSDKMKLIIYKQ